ncbi:DUF5990 family protein [Kitasatospora sp. GP82]|uniref:DUF5990 family protein n=1 Tax=Kitasatospora sp. GP82 TaxID=3035089 RepID=UPI0024757716|nr:DUF5990 family protein [Kitasatospora sp. GP82]MDH6125017.1 hypothetical protein [Kitasatospora sp. GP82]
MQIRIEASDLPGRACGAGADFPGADSIHVGVQRKDRPLELLDLQPGDASTAVWTLDCTAVETPTGIDLRGRYIQNRLGGRFIYLSWVTVDDTGGFTMFRRAKLMFDAIGQDTIAAAVRTGRLTARLRLTDAKGRPLCAHVRPPLVKWSAESAG